MSTTLDFGITGTQLAATHVPSLTDVFYPSPPPIDASHFSPGDPCVPVIDALFGSPGDFAGVVPPSFDLLTLG